MAPQPRRQMAHATRGSRRARRTSAADPAQRRAPRPPRRTPDLRDLLVAARGRRSAGGGVSPGHAGFFPAARRARLGRDDRRRLARRRGLSSSDAGKARHRRLFCRDLRAPAMSDRILILDFGSQVTQLIARRVRESGVYCEILPFTISEDRVRDFAPRGIILPVAPPPLPQLPPPPPPEIVFRLGVPVLGICYGMQTMCAQLRSRVTLSEHHASGPPFTTLLHHSRLLD